jgi:hypothetical protein
VSDKLKNLNATSLQLTPKIGSEFKISFFVIKLIFVEVHIEDSSIKPFSIPKWYIEIKNEKVKINNNKTLKKI